MEVPVSRTPLFDAVRRVIRLGRECHDEKISPSSAISRNAEHLSMRRRAVLGGAAAAAGALTLKSTLARAVPRGGSSARIAVIGGGLAGLVCADRLRAFGLSCVVYESNDRLGGRCYSNRTTFPGQVAENGGELIDNWHKVMLGYAQEFNLAREDLAHEPGETFYHFNGLLYSEADVVDEMRDLAGYMHDDIALISSAPDVFNHTTEDAFFDQMTLAEYLDSRAGSLPLVRGVLTAAYIGEYGRELEEQSALNFLLYMRSDRRSKFEPFGSSDERFHLVGGNDAITSHIADRLPGTVNLRTRVNGLRRLASGEYAIRFSGSTIEEIFDAVVVAVPFPVLRTWTLDASLGIPPQQLAVIQAFTMGYNAKLMVGFNSRPWIAHGSNGSAYADLPNLQNTWETNPTAANGHAILTDYLGGNNSLRIEQPTVGGTFSCGNCHTGSPSARVTHDELTQVDVEGFLTDLNRVYPGAAAAATRLPDGRVLSFLGHWTNQSGSGRGSYSCPWPGYFTGSCGLEAEPVDHLYFAGEHTNSFYWAQGFMEGAAQSGLDAANAILQDIKVGAL